MKIKIELEEKDIASAVQSYVDKLGYKCVSIIFETFTDQDTRHLKATVSCTDEK